MPWAQTSEFGYIFPECHDVVKGEACGGGRLDGVRFVPLPEQEMKGIGRVRTHAAVPPELQGRVEYVEHFHTKRATRPQGPAIAF